MSRSKNAGGNTPAYSLRAITTTDVFQMVRILRKLDIKSIFGNMDKNLLAAAEFKPPMKMEDGKPVPLPFEDWTEAQIEMQMKSEIATQQLGSYFLGALIDQIPSCEQEICKLLADSIGQDIDVIKTMSGVEFILLLQRYIDRDEFKGFFTAAWRLLGKMDSRSVSSSMQSMASSLM
jgi:hypothetical protein